jgi:hypothetical protein
MTEQQVGQAHGYIKEGDKEKLRARLRRIEGQVRGVQRMIDEEKYSDAYPPTPDGAVEVGNIVVGSRVSPIARVPDISRSPVPPGAYRRAEAFG